METIVIFALGTLIGVMGLYFLSISVAPYNPNEIKNDHFECGLPPSSDVPQKAKFQYFIFAIAFIIFDMAGLFFSLFAFSDNKETLTIAAIFGFLLFIAISIGMKEYRHVKNI